MKKIFETPNMVITEFESENVVTSSGATAKSVAEGRVNSVVSAKGGKALDTVFLEW